MPADTELWARLGAWRIDDDAAAISFTDRLRREQRWTADYARRAVEEYKRFLYLACTERAEMTPSEDVDAVWHLHLVHTRSYWDDLCGTVLRRPLHHGPTKGGAGERRRFGGAYGRTLEAYAAAFGAPPPADIWPPEAERFAKTGRMRWIDTGEAWVVPKGWLRRPVRLAGFVTLAALSLLAFAGRAEAGTAGTGGAPFALLIAGCIGAFLVYERVKWWRMTPEERAESTARKKNSGGCSSGGCSSGCSSSDGSSGGCSSGGCGGGCGGGSD